MSEVKITAKQRHELKRFIKHIEDFRGRHTELVSVYVPAGYELVKVIQQLSQEQGTASNIKSASTRKNVQDALEKMIQHLKLVDSTPPNGLACFSGNVAEREGQSDVQVYSIEPPVPLNLKLYRCDKDFKLDTLKEMCESNQVFGLVVMDRRDATFALLKGKKIVPLTKTHSEVPGKFKAGGQCLHPDTLVHAVPTVRLQELNVGNMVTSFNFESNNFESSKILDFWRVQKDNSLTIATEDNHSIICSKDHILFNDTHEEVPAEKLSIGDKLLKFKDQQLIKIRITEIKQNNEPIELIDISVANQNFIANGLLVHNSAQRFARLREGAIKDHYKKIAEYMKEQFFQIKEELKGIIIGGPSTTTNDFMNKDYVTGDLKKKIIAIKDLSYTGEFGLQELLDKSQDVLAAEEVAEEKEIMTTFLTMLAKEHGKVSYGEHEVKKMLEMGAVDKLLLSEDLEDELQEELEALAEAQGTDSMIISTDTREGVQLRDFGGIAAILRYDTSDMQ